MEIVPITLKDARRFVGLHHEHHDAPQGGLFAVGASDGTEIVAVVIVGRPVARMLNDGRTAEVTRLCTTRDDGKGPRNACSLLYAAAWRAARALGYQRLVTYTLATEGGESLRGAGWKCLGTAGGGSWDRAARPRADHHPVQEKIRWETTAEQRS